MKEIYLEKDPGALLNGIDNRTTARAEKGTDKRSLLEYEAVRCEDCRACSLYGGRSNAVFGDGDPNARVMFIGEAPGEEEDKLGLPFVGRAGKLLDRLLEESGLRRGEVYITNIVKCRPPENRDPTPEEIDACHPFLERQIQFIRPDVVVTLGLYATQALLDTKNPMVKLRGNVQDIREPIKVKVLPTYHPAAALRFPAYKEDIYTDFRKIEALLDEIDRA